MEYNKYSTGEYRIKKSQQKTKENWRGTIRDHICHLCTPQKHLDILLYLGLESTVPGLFTLSEKVLST